MKFYNWLIAFASGVGGFLFGYEIGIINQIFSMDNFVTTFGIQQYDSSGSLEDTSQAADIKGWITFVFLIGCATGAAVVSYPCDYIGRKRTIHEGSAFFIVGCILQTSAHNIGTLYAGRFIGGLGIGQMSAVVPLYISETAQTSIRGRLISIYQFMITIGIFIASCANSVILTYMTGEKEWRLAFGLQLIPAFFLVVIITALPFSPRWLLYKGRIDEARSTLAKLREVPETDATLIEEFEEINKSVEQDRAIGDAAWIELLEPTVLIRVAIGVTLQFFQQWTGINVILYYGTTLFANMGFPSADSSIGFVLADNGINMISTIPGMWLIERVGRRQLFIWGGAAMAFAHYMITMFVGLSDNVHKSLAWGGMVFIFVFIIAFAATWGPVTWVYQSEIFPLRVRAKGTSVSTVSNWVWNAVISKIAPLILKDITFYTYLIFGSFCVVMSLFAVFVVPETKGKSLEEIDEIFDEKVGKPRNPLHKKISASSSGLSSSQV